MTLITALPPGEDETRLDRLERAAHSNEVKIARLVELVERLEQRLAAAEAQLRKVGRA